MDKPVDTINRAIVRQGKGLSGQRWYRTLLALLLLLATLARESAQEIRSLF